jgi:hypothetical protein
MITGWIRSVISTRQPPRVGFDRLAEQIEACVHELNAGPQHQDLCCERTPDRIIIYGRSYPRLTAEIHFEERVGEERVGVVALRRNRTEGPSASARVITELRYQVTGARKIDPADYRRLARQVVRPLVESI